MKSRLARTGWAGALSLLGAVLVAAGTTAVLLPLSSDMPHWDQWYMTPVFEAHDSGRPVAPLLLAHYNGHYNWLPRALFYAMGRLTRWSLKAEVALGFFWAACTLAVLLRMLWDASPRLMVLALPFAAFTFSTLQNANLLNGFGMGQLLGTFAVVLSLFLLTDPRGGRGRFALALAAAVAAFVSHGATLALVPAGLVAVLFTGPRRSRGRVGLWCLVSSVGLALGAIGGRNVQMVVAWRRVPRFAVALLGRPFTIDQSPSVTAAIACGSVALAGLILVVAVRLARGPAARRDVLVRWASLGLAGVVAALLIAISKSRAPTEWALSTHYVSSTYLLAPALLVLVADAIRDALERSARKTLLALGLVLCASAPAVQQAVAASRVVPILRSWKAMDTQVSRRLAAGSATDRDILTVVNSEVEFTRRSVEFLRSRRLAWFAHAREARRPFGALDSVAGRAPASTVVLRAGEPWTFEGWALPPLTAPSTPLDVVLVTDGATVAEARPARPRPDRAAYFGSAAFASCGFLLVAPDGARQPPGRYAVRVALRTPTGSTTLRRLEVVVR